MDVGCSGGIDTYSIIENADYSFAELSCDILSEEKDEDFPDLCDRLKEYRTKPLIWSEIESDNIDLCDFDNEGGYVKKYLLDIFSKIDEAGGEYVVVSHSPETMRKDRDGYIDIINSISTLAGSYGLEIILLFSGKNEKELRQSFGEYILSENCHPFLKYGFDFCCVEDYCLFFENFEETENMKYFRIPAKDTPNSTFRENLLFMADTLADSDVYLCVWSNLEKITDKVMTNKYI